MSENFILVAISLLFGLAVVNAQTTTNDGQLFQFKFDPKKPLTYAVEFKTREMNDSEVGQRSTLTHITTDISYKIKLTPACTNKDGTMSIWFEPFDYESESHSHGPSGDIDSTTRGLSIINKQNGIVTVDTDKGIGLAQAKTMKQAVYPHLLNGYMNFEPTGNIKNFGGDLPFIDTWEDSTKSIRTIFYIVFPTNAIAVNDAWTNYYSLKMLGPVIFNGDGIVQQWGYIRGPDQKTANSTVANFSLYMSNDYKDVDGYVDQFGQQTAVDLPEYYHSMNARFQFDQQRGCLISMTESDSVHEDMSMMVQGNSATGHSETEGSITITLISP